jgi:hypothetical protein
VQRKAKFLTVESYKKYYLLILKGSDHWDAAWLAKEPSDDIIMIANISETEITPSDMIILSAGSTTPSSAEEDRVIWLIDSAASSHISGKRKSISLHAQHHTC